MTEPNIPLQGLSPRGVDMPKGFSLTARRMCTPRTDELIVGAGILR